MLHTIDIKPKDNFTVTNRGKLSELDRKVIHMLYQPLIGVSATSLYFTLLNEVREDNMWSPANTHIFLLEFTGESLITIAQSKKKLEAIGLLRTYMKQGVSNDNYIYEINPPLSSENFFRDELMSVLLKQKIGETYYQKMIETFSGKVIPPTYTEVTASFNNVFEIGNSKQELIEQRTSIANDMENKQFFNSDSILPPNDFGKMFDFELLFNLLKNNLVDISNFTNETYETISVLAYLYEIPVTYMSSLILKSTGASNNVDCEKLKHEAREYYLISNNHNLPQLIEKVQRVEYRTIFNPKTDEERMLYGFENNSPLQVLTHLMNGARPSAKELEIIESVMINQKLSPGVMNVLMHYCLQKSDMRLSKNYVETIASTLAKKKIVKVIDAFNYLKESSKPKNVVNSNTNKNYSRSRNVKKEEVIPSWFGNANETTKPMTNDQAFPEGLQALFEKTKKGEN